MKIVQIDATGKRLFNMSIWRYQSLSAIPTHGHLAGWVSNKFAK